MRRNRSDMFDPKVQGTYHVYSRCALSAWLLSRKERERRARLLEILEELAAIYAIAVLASAFLSNHFHLILVNLPELVKSWTDRDVLIRAQRAFPHRFKKMGIHGPPTEEQMKTLLVNHRLIKEMRSRLSDISWMIRLLKQRFAAEMNREMETTGHFWDGRFKMVEITSEAHLITTMIYIALNQIKAGQASSFDTSVWTSVCWQLQAREMFLAGDAEEADRRAGFLAPISSTDDNPPPQIRGGQLNSRRARDSGTLEMPFDEFLRLTMCAYELSKDQQTAPCGKTKSLLKRHGLSVNELASAITGVAQERVKSPCAA